jgi:hypothetical protein
MKDLENESFKTRNEASKEMEKHVDVLAPTILKVLAANPSLELRRRLSQIVDMYEGHWSSDSLRTLRAIEVLERVGSKEALAVIDSLARGAPESRLTREAKASQKRLAR